jgi:hypothetical protein
MTKSDPYLSNELCIERLYKEYQKHNRLIIAVDYDDTLYDWHGKGTTHEFVIDLMKRCKALGFYVVIFTASKVERHTSIRVYCAEKGIEIDSINKNPIALPYGNEGKIYYNIFLCDRAGLRSSYYILEQVVTRIEKERREKVYLKPTDIYNGHLSDLDSIFLAGSISNAVDWQQIAADKLTPHFDVFNPRRYDFNVLDSTMEEEQIKWEFEHLVAAKQVIFWFSNETLAPISLYGLGLFGYKAHFIGIHPEFKRKRDVEIQTKLRNPDAKIFYDLNEMLDAVIASKDVLPGNKLKL